jgi:hypothetical protein
LFPWIDHERLLIPCQVQWERRWVHGHPFTKVDFSFAHLLYRPVNGDCQRTIDQLVTEITPSSEKVGSGIKVFTIAYGSDADAGKLTRIANATGARECIGTPENIDKVYLEISDFFGVGDLAANGMAPLCS